MGRNNLTTMDSEDAFIKAIEEMVEYEHKRRKKWEGVLVRIAKTAFETLLGVKKGDLVNYNLILPKKVIYDDVCMDDYGEFKVRCYHLKKDGTPRKNPSYERWGVFYDNEIKIKE